MSNKETLPQQFCTRCGEFLTDKLKSTRLAHDRIKHSNVLKKQARQKKQNIVAIGICGLMVGIVIYLGSNITLFGTLLDPFEKMVANQKNIKMLTSDQLETCAKRIYTFEQVIHQQKTFTSDNVAEMNYLLENCNTGFVAFKFGDNMFNDKGYDQPYHDRTLP